MDDATAAIVANDRVVFAALMAARPELVMATVVDERFVEAIVHQVYRGDTLLHVAAAAFRATMVADLITRGADVAARNRRGATPLHYAADTNHRDPEAQVATIAALLAAGAEPNARDKDGTTPLHRAIRKRGAAAVKALIQGDANVHLVNGSGTSAMKLARIASGRGGSGSPEAKAEQAEIIRLLAEVGARA